MFSNTTYEIVNVDGHQVVRSESSNSRTIIDTDTRTGAVSVSRRA